MARFWILSAATVALGLAWNSWAQSVEVRVGPVVPDGVESEGLPEAPSEWTVGDPIPVTVVLTAPLAPDVAPPAEGILWPWNESWGEAEVLEVFPPVGPLQVQGELGVSRYQQRLLLAGFRPGDIPLPAVTIPITPELALETPSGPLLPIRAVLEPPEEDPQPSALRSPVPLHSDAAFWWLNGVLALGCLILAAVALARRRGVSVGLPGRGHDPLTALERILEGLRTEPAAEPFHTRLSMALRRYLADRLAFPAEESTTPEIADRTRRQLPPPVHARLGSLLEECDGVKFARLGADERSMAQRRQNAGEAARKVEGWWRGRRTHAPRSSGDNDA